MGLTLFYDLRYPAERSREEALAAIGALRARAAQLPVGYVSPLFDLSVESDDSNESERVAGRRFLRFCAECLADPFVDDDHPRFTGNADSAFGFAVNAGDRCETATFGLIRRRADADGREEWFWWSGPKTQYASLVSEEYFVEAHCRLIAILDAAVELGFEVDVRDDGGYWKSRSVDELLRQVRYMNHIVAKFVGKFSDAVDGQLGVQAPIASHRDFERLEMDAK